MQITPATAAAATSSCPTAPAIRLSPEEQAEKNWAWITRACDMGVPSMGKSGHKGRQNLPPSWRQSLIRGDYALRVQSLEELERWKKDKEANAQFLRLRNESIQPAIIPPPDIPSVLHDVPISIILAIPAGLVLLALIW